MRYKTGILGMARVFVWRMKKVSGGVNVGHASALCNKVEAPSPLGTDPRYISYWPNTGATPKRPASSGYDTPSYDDDVVSEGGNPDVIIDLSCLDDAAMVQWWSGIREQRAFIGPYRLEYWPKDRNYNLYRTNCSTLVALALKIGGAENYVPKPVSVMDTPGLIEDQGCSTLSNDGE